MLAIAANVYDIDRIDNVNFAVFCHKYFFFLINFFF